MKIRISIIMLTVLMLSCWVNLDEKIEEVKPVPFIIRSSGITNDWRVLAMDVMPTDASLFNADPDLDLQCAATGDVETISSIVNDPSIQGNRLLRFNDPGSTLGQFTEDLPELSGNYTIIVRVRALAVGNSSFQMGFSDISSQNEFALYANVQGFSQVVYSYTDGLGGLASDSFFWSSVPSSEVQWHIFRINFDNSIREVNFYLDELPLPFFSLSPVGNASSLSTGFSFGDWPADVHTSLYEIDWIAWHPYQTLNPSSSNVPSGLTGFPY